MLPPKVEIELSDTVRKYWFARLAQHMKDSYLGVPLLKFPEDLRVYEHLLWESRANVVIELGTNRGGSALWFNDRLEALARHGRIDRPAVVSVDIDQSGARAALSGFQRSTGSLTLLEGDVRDPGLPDRVAQHIPPDATCMVVEDSAHKFATTLAALRGFARFVPPGGYFVVEDGCVDVAAMRPSRLWPRGVLPAIHDFLGSAEGEGFVVRRDLERYGVSCHICGFLQRRAANGDPPAKSRFNRGAEI